MSDVTTKLEPVDLEKPGVLKRNLTYLSAGIVIGRLSREYDFGGFALALGCSMPLIGAANAERGEVPLESFSATAMYSLGVGLSYLDKIGGAFLMTYLDGI